MHLPTDKKPEMTPRERVLAAMRRQSVDHVPCSTPINPLHEVQRRGRPWNFPWSVPGDGAEYLAVELGTDPVVGLWWLEGLCPGERVTVRVWTEGELLHKAYETPAGTLSAAVLLNDLWPFGRDIPFFHDFVAHYREHWIKSEADLECLRYVMLPPRTAGQIAAMRSRLEGPMRLARRLHLPTMATVGAGLTGALYMFGAERLCLLTVDEPGLVDAYLEIEHRWNLRMIELALDWGVDIIRRNGFYESADFFSPAALERFLGSRLREEVAAIHQGDRPAAYTVYSGIMPMLDYLAGIGFDCIAHLDIAFDSVDLRAINAKLGREKSFWTGPSNTFHMYAKDPEVVRRAVREVFGAFGKVGLILGAASSVHPMMPWANTLAMLDEWRKLRDI
jgi:uroporphyrinogen-III decarboxylase